MLNPIVLDQQNETPGSLNGVEHYGTLVGTGAVICLTNDLMPIDRKNWLVPAWLI